ncbi:similar to Saccharomyces cerevisiae YIL031W ULP2 Peptidase that deconjugates Smt3/SUMO-1 peptides from proteins [Maudiozyma saulgeensis]|uniref:Similar to Saccharomyces cerevisiae YIL031W ULP2 Peptidase that deconjugates Smt3/SUMO-1 peptides from proteins n=1 Tax=Maudiozyma saulgeensis TaxID=1789683 RepID=A0A1X7R6T3_9SACH|nr:similar to Saccharomyces cerevisiae YIL031W ULP2 Peptidase that deconjugates Smt3/SUMO-1 peptides from proteins [Kazachstania saulgeensis]
MSSRRPKRSFSSTMPLDHLSSPPQIKSHAYKSIHNSSTRYNNKGRSTPISEREINDMTSKNFLPSSPTDDSINTSRKSLENEDSSDYNEQFDSMDGSSPLKKRHTNHKSNGLLNVSSSPSISNSPSRSRLFKRDSVKYQIPGSLEILTIVKNSNVKRRPILLTFMNDNGVNPYIHFTYKSVQLKDVFIDFNRDCETVMFDRKYTCFAVIFKKIRKCTFENNGSRYSKTFYWSNMNNNNNDDRKLNKINHYLVKSKAAYNIKILKTSTDILNEITLYNNQLSKEKSKSIADETSKNLFNEFNKKRELPASFLSKNFLSLQNKSTSSLNHRPLTKTGNSIQIPKNQSNGSRSSGPTSISSGSFYHNSKSSLNTHKLSEIRRSNRIRNNVNIEDITKEEEDREKPKLFKPKLRYNFSDDSKYTITNQDFKCLYNNDWINDTLIDFFTKYYVTDSISKNIIQKDDVSIMSSFFYTKLISDPENYYENVKKWVQHSDLFAKKFIIIPININYHWFGCIIYNLDTLFKFLLVKQEGNKTQGSQAKEITEMTRANEDTPLSNENKRDSEGDQNGQDDNVVQSDDITEVAPTIQILTFDSLRGIHSRELDPIKDFLIAYALDKYSLVVDKSWIKMKTCLVPQQPNMSDCGVHVILTIKKFFENPKETVNIWNSISRKNKEASKLVNEYFEKSKRNVNARKELRKVLWDLQATQIKWMEENNENNDDSDDGNADYEDEDLEIIENIPELPKGNGKKEPDILEGNDIIEKERDSVSEEHDQAELKIESSQKELTDNMEQKHEKEIRDEAQQNNEKKMEHKVDEKIDRGDTSILAHNHELNDSKTKQLSSVPPSPVPFTNIVENEVRHIPTEDIDESMVKTPALINLKTTAIQNRVDAPDYHQHDIIVSGDEKLLPEKIVAIPVTETKGRISSKYFPKNLKGRVLGFRNEKSPTLSDRDYRENVTDEEESDNIPASINSLHFKHADDIKDTDTSYQNIVISDIDKDDDVNLIGQSSNISINPHNIVTSEPESNNDSSSRAEDNIDSIKNNINRELYNNDSSNFIDLSSPSNRRRLEFLEKGYSNNPSSAISSEKSEME